MKNEQFDEILKTFNEITNALSKGYVIMFIENNKIFFINKAWITNSNAGKPYLLSLDYGGCSCFELSPNTKYKEAKDFISNITIYCKINQDEVSYQYDMELVGHAKIADNSFVRQLGARLEQLTKQLHNKI